MGNPSLARSLGNHNISFPSNPISKIGEQHLSRTLRHGKIGSLEENSFRGAGALESLWCQNRMAEQFSKHRLMGDNDKNIKTVDWTSL